MLSSHLEGLSRIQGCHMSHPFSSLFYVGSLQTASGHWVAYTLWAFEAIMDEGYVSKCVSPFAPYSVSSLFGNTMFPCKIRLCLLLPCGTS